MSVPNFSRDAAQEEVLRLLDAAEGLLDTNAAASGRIAEQALAQAEQIGDDRLLARAICTAAAPLLFQHALHEAEYRYHHAIQVAREVRDASLTARALNGLGLCCFKRGDLADALEHFLEGLRAVPEQDTFGRLRLLNNAGLVHVELHEYRAALDAHMQVAALTEELGDDTRLLTAVTNIVADRYALGEDHLVLSLVSQYEGAVARAELAHHTLVLAMYRLMSHRRLGRAVSLAEAEAVLGPLVAQSEAAADWDNVVHALTLLGEFALDSGHTTKARTLLERVLKIARSYGLRPRERDALKLLSDALRLEGAWEAAFEVLTAHQLLDRTLRDERLAWRARVASHRVEVERLRLEAQAERQRTEQLLEAYAQAEHTQSGASRSPALTLPAAGPPEAAADPERLLVQARYAILDTLPQGAFEGLTELAAFAVDADGSILMLRVFDDLYVQVCGSAKDAQSDLERVLAEGRLDQAQMLVTSDATQDERLKDLTLGGARFVVLVPLVTSDGVLLGALGVFGAAPCEERLVSTDAREALAAIAEVVVRELELRCEALAARQDVLTLKATMHSLREAAATSDALLGVSQLLELELPPLEVVTHSFELVSRITDIDVCVLVSEQGRGMEVQTTWSRFGARSAAPPIVESLAWTAFNGSTPRYASSYEHLQDADPAALAAGVRSAAWVPLDVNNGARFLVAFARLDEARAWSTRDRRILESVARSISTLFRARTPPGHVDDTESTFPLPVGPGPSLAGQNETSPPTKHHTLLTYHGVTYDPPTRTLRGPDASVGLSPREAEVLEALFRRPEHVVSRQVLLGERPHDQSSLDVQMLRLRRKLGGVSADLVIETRRGTGYILRKALTDG